MLGRAVLLALTVAAVAMPAARADTPAPACPGLTATADTFATVGPGGLYWLENMGFDGRGGMWVSELFLNKLQRFDAAAQQGPAVTIAAPGASLLRPDGRMYAVFGDSTTGALPGSSAGLMTFDPAADAPVAEPFAAGMTMANGAALDPDGNVYVANSIATGVVKFRPDGSEDATFRTAAPVESGDGVAVIGDTLYVTQLTPPDSPITTIPLASPEQYTTFTQLSPGGVPLLLDDLDIGPDGQLYVASNRGQILRVNPDDGSACIVYSGAAPLNSVRFAKAFPPYGRTDLFTTSELGTITHVKLSGPAVAKPPITLRVRPNRVTRGKRARLRFLITSPAPCREGVHIAGATTGADGRATVRRKLRHARTFTARKPGCVRTTVRVRVRR